MQTQKTKPHPALPKPFTSRSPHATRLTILLTGTICAVALAVNAKAFEGRIDAVTIKGAQSDGLLYMVGANTLRVGMTEPDKPNPVNLIELKSGTLTLIFPHNHSFLRLCPATGSNFPGLPRGSDMSFPPSGLPPGTDPQFPPGSGATLVSLMPPMPMRPDKIELKSTGRREKILGYECEQFEIKQRGETMEIWATDKLLPFQPYVRTQSSRFGPRRLEEQWAALLTEKKLFPLRATLRFENGVERFRFEVKTIKPEKVEDGTLFQPPDDYTEIPALPGR